VKKLIKAVGSIVAACLLLSIGSYIFVNRRVTTAGKRVAASLEKNTFQPEELRADVAFYRDLYRRVHPTPIANLPLRDVDGELARLESSIEGPMTRLELYRELAPIISSIGDEHTGIQMPAGELETHRREGGRVFPFTVEFIDGSLLVADSKAAGAGIPLGTGVAAVNGVPVVEVVTRLEGLFSGASHVQREAFVADGFADALYLAFEFDDEFILDVVDRETGRMESIPVEGSVRSDQPADALSVMVNQSPLQPAPLNSYEVLPSGDVLFTFNAFEDTDGHLSALLDEMFEYLNGGPGCDLVIDLRRNPGGTTAIADELIGYFFDRPFRTIRSVTLRVSPELKRFFLSFVPGALRWLPIQYIHPLLRPLWLAEDGGNVEMPFDEIQPEPSRPVYRGRIIVLTGPGAYSSSAMLVATMKKHGMATLVGMPTGGSPTHYGNSIELRLPNSALKVYLASSINLGHGAGPVEPDHVVEQTVEDLRLGRDTQLEFALRLLAGDQPQNTRPNAERDPKEDEQR
jgi:hypothetical protein